jgi:VHL beta domain
LRLVLLAAALVTLASCSGTCSGTASPTPSPTPTPVARLPVADASCQAEAHSQSLNSNTPTSFTITNHTSETLTVFWVNFKGQRVKYFDLGPGETHNPGTFVTHPWVVADPRGTCIRLFLVTTPAQVTI